MTGSNGAGWLRHPSSSSRLSTSRTDGARDGLCPRGVNHGRRVCQALARSLPTPAAHVNKRIVLAPPRAKGCPIHGVSWPDCLPTFLAVSRSLVIPHKAIVPPVRMLGTLTRAFTHPSPSQTFAVAGLFPSDSPTRGIARSLVLQAAPARSTDQAAQSFPSLLGDCSSVSRSHGYVMRP
jgi:hypothetical protein